MKISVSIIPVIICCALITICCISCLVFNVCMHVRDEKEVTTNSESYADGDATVTTTARNYKIPKTIQAPMRVSTKTGDYEIDIDGNIRRVR